MEKTGITILKSLYSNEKVIDGARHKKWFIAIIMLVLSVVVSLVPTFVSLVNASGDSFIKSNQYGTEVALTRFVEKIDTDETATFSIKLDENNKKYLDLAEEGVYFKHKDSENEVDFAVYLLNDSTRTKFNTVRNNITKGKVNPFNTAEDADPDLVNKSFLLLSKTYIAMTIYVKGSAKTSFTGDIASFKEGYSLKDLNNVLDGEGNLIPFDTTDSAKYALYTAGTLKNYLGFFKTAYLATKNSNLLTNTLILAGVNLVIVLFMGLLMFILTRGKTNPLNRFTFWDCQKIAYWATVTPALISVALGFMLSNFSTMAFAMVFGLRCMWLSMRQLRPVNPEQQQ